MDGLLDALAEILVEEIVQGAPCHGDAMALILGSFLVKRTITDSHTNI